MIKSVLSLVLVLLTLPIVGMEEPRVLAMDQETLNQGLIRAIKQGTTQEVRELLNLGAQPIAQEGVARRRSAFELAYHRRSGEMCELLVARGAPVDKRFVNSEDLQSGNRLVEAAEQENLPLCQFLLHHGANVNGLESGQFSALYYAVHNRNHNLCCLLLNAGANVSLGDTLSGPTPLHIAASKGYTNICRILLDAGADIYLQDFSGHTPLHLAATQGHRATCKLLLSKNHVTFLGCIRRLAVEGSLEAQSLYRERHDLLRPHLEYQSFEEILEDTPERRAELRLERLAQENAARLQMQNNDINNNNNAPQLQHVAPVIAADPQAAPHVPVVAPAIAPALIPAPINLVAPAPGDPDDGGDDDDAGDNGNDDARIPESSVVGPEYRPEQAQATSFLNKPVTRSMLAMGGIAILSVAIYKLYQWMNRKPVKQENKEESVQKKKAQRARPKIKTARTNQLST